MSKIKVIVFDSNETLLDLSVLDPAFVSAFGDSQARKEWFNQLLALFLTSSIVDEFRDFNLLADEAVSMVAEWRGRTIEKKDRAAIFEAMLAARAYPDVVPALTMLKSAGLRLAVLTNGGEKASKAQAKHAGIGDYFEKTLSAESVKCFKPGRRAYEYAAKELDVDPKEIRLVAGHAWDIAGAKAAGCKTGFVARPDKAPARDSAPPDLEGADLIALAKEIVAHDG